MKKKELYIAPQTEQIILGSDQGILSGSPYGNEGEAGPLTNKPYGDF